VSLAAGTSRLNALPGGTAAITGAIGGDGGLLKEGEGWFWLFNPANTYAGATSVTQGNLYAVAPGTLGAQAAAGLTVSDTGAFVARVRDRAHEEVAGPLDDPVGAQVAFLLPGHPVQAEEPEADPPAEGALGIGGEEGLPPGHLVGRQGLAVEGATGAAGLDRGNGRHGRPLGFRPGSGVEPLAAGVAEQGTAQVRGAAVGAFFLYRPFGGRAAAVAAEPGVRGKVLPAGGALLEDQELVAAVGAEFGLLGGQLPAVRTDRRRRAAGAAAGGAPRKASLSMAGIMKPIPMPRPAPASPWLADAVSSAMAAFIFRSRFMSSKRPSRLLSSIAFCTSGGGVIALM
jgi:hypothetical protein